MKQRLYIDTSVFGGYYDDEFEEFTKPLFDRILKDEFMLLFSTVTQDELENSPTQVQELVRHLKVEFTEFIDLTGEAVELATQYITEKIVGQTSYADCLHIALATIHRADFIMGYNSINIKNGYKQLEIRSPRDFMTYEDDNL